MTGYLQTRVRKQPIIALHFEFENELKFYNLRTWLLLTSLHPAREGSQTSYLSNGASTHR